MTEQDLEGALSALDRALRPVSQPWMVIGGIAVIARGVPRHTADVDATIWAEGLEPEDLVERLAREGVVPRIRGAVEFAREHQVLLLRHESSGTELELSLAWLPFEREALDAAEPLRLRGVEVPVARHEDLLIYKAVAWRPRDRGDVENLLEQHLDDVDLARVRRIVAQFADALDEPERVDEFESIVRRVRDRD